MEMYADFSKSISNSNPHVFRYNNMSAFKPCSDIDSAPPDDSFIVAISGAIPRLLVI